MEKIIIVHLNSDGEEIEREDVTNRVMEDPNKMAFVINTISNEVSDYNRRQLTLVEKGLISKPKSKTLITN